MVAARMHLNHMRVNCKIANKFYLFSITENVQFTTQEQRHTVFASRTYSWAFHFALRLSLDTWKLDTLQSCVKLHAAKKLNSIEVMCGYHHFISINPQTFSSSKTLFNILVIGISYGFLYEMLFENVTLYFSFNSKFDIYTRGRHFVT